MSVYLLIYLCIYLLVSQDQRELGEVMLSLCYLPTAGRLTLTVIKMRNLRAMDITGSSGEADNPSCPSHSPTTAPDSLPPPLTPCLSSYHPPAAHTTV